MAENNEEEQKIEKEAFQKFDKGATPVDIVKEGICSSEEAKQIYRRYLELEDMRVSKMGPEDIIEKLSTQIGLLGSRLARVELQLSESLLLPKTRECGKCGNKTTFSVGVLCHKCGKLDVFDPDEKRKNFLQHANFEGYRPWEEDEEKADE